ncbi:2-hydroxychromene-2-carboxylate isomerase [Hyphomicrobium sp. CS1GBMeth3]|uniref:2-hydroxychromene-2-carboxylate isomerase n=1 Tax=Hyphomicrobium sp. CS1GBMeth3 TaxID=1892845 RepID=UPI00092FFDB3|nr:2-hydroxychromene-2-carboxylate isomerase [Hyphomicrobium sp. CS1GBMeth3]
MSASHLDFWFDFGSTYSYPAAERIRPLADAAGVAVRFRPFMLGAIFKAQGWNTSPFNIYPSKGRYMWRDLARICADLDLPLVQPDPFPQSSLLAARVAVAAADQDWIGDYCVEVFREAFTRGHPIAETSVIEGVVARCGGDGRLYIEEAQRTEVKDRLRAETDYAANLGIFGAPTFIAPDGELFWGNDRLERAIAWSIGSVSPARASTT